MSPSSLQPLGVKRGLLYGGAPLLDSLSRGAISIEPEDMCIAEIYLVEIF